MIGFREEGDSRVTVTVTITCLRCDAFFPISIFEAGTFLMDNSMLRVPPKFPLFSVQPPMQRSSSTSK